MNIYTSHTLGEREISVTIDIDSEKQTDVNFAREVLQLGTGNEQSESKN